MNTQYQKDQYLSLEEFMDYLGMGRSAAYKIVRDPQFGCFKLAGSWRVPVTAIDTYVNLKREQQREYNC